MSSILGQLRATWQNFQRQQNRSIVWGAKFGILLTAFLLIYLPAQHQYENLSKNLAQRNKDINSAKQSGLNLLEPKELEDAEKNIKDFEAELVDVAQASTMINLVSDEAAKHNLAIANINSESLAPIKNEAGLEVERSGKKLKRIPIHIQFDSNLKGVATFLKSLSESSKHLWVMDTLLIQKISPQSDDLKCDMTLSFFAY